MKNYSLISLSVSALLLSGCLNKSQEDLGKPATEIWPEIKSEILKDDAVETRVADLLSTMTLKQKVAQMIQPEIRDITVEDMRKYGFGSYLNGGGAFPNNNKHSSVSDWVDLAEKMYQASVDDSIDGSSIPTMWGTDAVHGHNNVIGATIFPHNIGLGAANNPQLIEKIAKVTSTEVQVTGIDWIFAPTVAVVQDDRWGRAYESYSEKPEIVRDYSYAIVKGMQGNLSEESDAISTVKHFIGDGGTTDGDDQGNTEVDEKTLFEIHGQGYVGGLTAGAQSVMASFNSWNGDKIHGNKYLLTDVLKEKMGFDGFVVGDWNGHGQITGCTNESCPQAVNAGIDILMVPTAAWKPLYHNTISQVQSGEISQSRIDDAVTRILRVKVRSGLLDKSSPANRALANKVELIGAQKHRDVARQAVRESLVLLKNKNNLLPLDPKLNVLVAGDGADNIGKQSGGWTITWQGTGNENKDFPGGTSIYQGLADQVNSAGGSIQLLEGGDISKLSSTPDVAIVVFGEEPYAEGNGDLSNLEYQRGNKSDLALLTALKQKGIPVVSVFITGRPLWVNPELNQSDSFVVAWLPGSEGAGVADLLLKSKTGDVQYDFTGRLSFSWPMDKNQTDINYSENQNSNNQNSNNQEYQPLFAYGYGMSGKDPNKVADNLPVESSSTDEVLEDYVLFERSMKAPWLMFLHDDSNSKLVNSSVMDLAGISYKTIDIDVQEDGRQVTWKPLANEMGLSSIAIEGAFPEDLRAFEEANSSLNLTIRQTKPNTAPVKLSMGCRDHCNGELDIAPLLNKVAINEWQTVSVDLACLKEKGVDFSQIFTGFSLSSKASKDEAYEVQFSKIWIEPKANKDNSSGCPL